MVNLIDIMMTALKQDVLHCESVQTSLKDKVYSCVAYS